MLGLCLALAPGGVWYAVTADVAMAPVYLMAAVMFWVAGFDIIYSCQDEAFDRSAGLRALPAELGTASALWWSRLFHTLASVCLLLFGAEAHLGWVYYLGVACFALLLVSQHRLVRPGDLTRINAAFFTRNGLASVLFFIAVLADRAVRHV